MPWETDAPRYLPDHPIAQVPMLVEIQAFTASRGMRLTREFVKLEVSYACLPLGPPIIQAKSRPPDSLCSPLAEAPRSRRKNPVFFLCSFFSAGGEAGVTTVPGSGGGPGDDGRLCPALLPRLGGREESAQSAPILGGGSKSCSTE